MKIHHMRNHNINVGSKSEAHNCRFNKTQENESGRGASVNKQLRNPIKTFVLLMHIQGLKVGLAQPDSLTPKVEFHTGISDAKNLSQELFQLMGLTQYKGENIDEDSVDFLSVLINPNYRIVCPGELKGALMVGEMVMDNIAKPMGRYLHRKPIERPFNRPRLAGPLNYQLNMKDLKQDIAKNNVNIGVITNLISLLNCSASEENGFSLTPKQSSDQHNQLPLCQLNIYTNTYSLLKSSFKKENGSKKPLGIGLSLAMTFFASIYIYNRLTDTDNHPVELNERQRDPNGAIRRIREMAAQIELDDAQQAAIALLLGAEPLPGVAGEQFAEIVQGPGPMNNLPNVIGIDNEFSDDEDERVHG